jgi:hypothetical protein
MAIPDQGQHLHYYAHLAQVVSVTLVYDNMVLLNDNTSCPAPRDP